MKPSHYVSRADVSNLRRDGWKDGAMSETSVIALAGIAATLLGGLGATLLANAHARRLDHVRRASALQDAARALVVTIIVEGRALKNEVVGLGTVLAHGADIQKNEHYLNAMLEEGSGVKDNISVHYDALKRAIVEGRLLSNDVPLKVALEDLDERMDFWSQVIQPQREALRTGFTDPAGLLTPVQRWEASFGSGLRAVEEIAARLVASSLAPLPRSGTAPQPQRT